MHLTSPREKILRTTLNYKREMGWSEIEFKNPSMQEGIQGLFLTIEQDLQQVRHSLPFPRHFPMTHSHIRQSGILQHPRVYFDSSVSAELVSTLNRVLSNHSGSVVSSPEEATHVVQYDADVDGGGSQEVEADYLRTLEMRPEAGIAFVHWWYHPDSYDEWIPLQDVEGQPPDEDELNRCDVRRE